ncbi:hypothetical protein C8R48DRAFT_780882 [Suillus tomentosus]|nr:hypothetical protein C8R48DRAFT_780882 [Suillus tomentosus]
MGFNTDDLAILHQTYMSFSKFQYIINSVADNYFLSPMWLITLLLPYRRNCSLRTHLLPMSISPSRRQLKHEVSSNIDPVSTSTDIAVFMDPAQNLLAVVYAVPSGPHQSDETFRLDLRALNGDSVHPRGLERVN